MGRRGSAFDSNVGQLIVSEGEFDNLIQDVGISYSPEPVNGDFTASAGN